MHRTFFEKEIKKFTRINSSTVWKLNNFPWGSQLTGCRTGLAHPLAGWIPSIRDIGSPKTGGIPNVYLGVFLSL
jgi:hypothetical protein